MSPFLAWIIPWQISDAHPEHPIVLPPDKPEQPPVEGAPPHPAHPIVLPGYPAHPIVLPPLGTWGGANEPFPTPPIAGVPGTPGYKPPEISGPPGPWPTPPIVIPDPPSEKPPGGETGTPENPIELPPTTAGGYQGYWIQAFFPQLNGGKGGWMWVWVPIGDAPPHVEHYKGRDKKK